MPTKDERCGGKYGRKVINIFEYVASLRDVCQKDREQNTDHLLCHCRKQHEENGIFQCNAERRILEKQFFIICQPDKPRRCQCCIIAQRIVNHLKDRDDEDQNEHDQSRCNENKDGFFVF